MAYRIVDVFVTLQGEGFHAGTPAIFVRFSGCNLWTGRVEDRQRDFTRTGGACALFCDTDFATGFRCDVEGIVARIQYLRKRAGGMVGLVVFTGGEPMLQLDLGLLRALRQSVGPRVTFAVETNGTVEASAELLSEIDWICCSPKTPAERVVIGRIDELKVVVPAMSPAAFEGLPAEHWFVQPEAAPDLDTPGGGAIIPASVAAAVDYCLAHPLWRLSLQTHKTIGLP